MLRLILGRVGPHSQPTVERLATQSPCPLFTGKVHCLRAKHATASQGFETEIVGLNHTVKRTNHVENRPHPSAKQLHPPATGPRVKTEAPLS